jgi:DNA-binding CsgD family transcriptional regulator
MNFASEVAELALGSASLQVFYEEFVSSATRVIGAAGGGIYTVDRSGYGSAACNLFDPQVFASEIAIGSTEFSQSEIQQALVSGTVLDETIFSSKRRDALSYFREIVEPLGGRGVFRLTGTQHALSYFGFASETTVCLRKFAEQAIPKLESAAPVLRLARKLFSQSPAHGGLSRALSLEFKLTPAEHDTMDLVMRGLTNSDIATVHGVSSNTVRNQLATCFKKLRVSTRTEAAFVLRHAVECAENGALTLADCLAILQRQREMVRRGEPAIVYT